MSVYALVWCWYNKNKGFIQTWEHETLNIIHICIWKSFAPDFSDWTLTCLIHMFVSSSWDWGIEHISFLQPLWMRCALNTACCHDYRLPSSFSDVHLSTYWNPSHHITDKLLYHSWTDRLLLGQMFCVYNLERVVFLSHGSGLLPSTGSLGPQLRFKSRPMPSGSIRGHHEEQLSSGLLKKE